MNKRSNSLIDCFTVTRPYDRLSELVEGLRYTDIDLTLIVDKANTSKLGYERALILLALEVKLNPEITDSTTFQDKAMYLPAILDIMCNDTEANEMMIDRLDLIVKKVESQLKDTVPVENTYKLIGSVICRSMKSIPDDRFRLNGYIFDGFSMIKSTCILFRCNLLYWNTRTVVMRINILTGEQRIIDVLEEYSQEEMDIPDKIDFDKNSLTQIAFKSTTKDEEILKAIETSYNCILSRFKPKYSPLLRIRVKHAELVKHSELTSRLFTKYNLVSGCSVSYAVRLLEEVYESDYEKLTIICLGLYMSESCRWNFDTCVKYNFAVMYSAYYKYLFFHLHNQSRPLGKRLVDSMYNKILSLLESGDILNIEVGLKECMTEELLQLFGDRYSIIDMLYIPDRYSVVIVCDNLDIIEYNIKVNTFTESNYKIYNYNELYSRIIDCNCGKIISIHETITHGGRQHNCRVLEVNNLASILKKTDENYIILMSKPFKIYLSNDNVIRYWIESIK